MCGETRTYRCYPECVLRQNTGGFLDRLLRSTPEEPGFHEITIRTIQLCQNATNQQTDPTCGNVKDLTPSGTLQKVGYSEFTGECPACVNGAKAAATAVQEACQQTHYESGFNIGASDRSSTAGSTTSKESSGTIKPRKPKADKKKSKK